MDQLPPEMAPVQDFIGLNCGRVLGRNLRFAGFQQPTPVQGNSVPMAIGGLDVISVAQTGSGKTLAFMLPILYKLLEAGPVNSGGGGGRNSVVAISGLALSPTRELAQQIHEESKKFAFRTGLKICVAYGGTPFGEQMRELERGCDVLVATPGRLDDMIQRRRVTLSQVRFLVLDEADRMLDMGFEPQIRNIVERADMPPSGPQGRQTMMFSATFPRAVMRIAESFLDKPVMLKVGRFGGAASSVTQKVMYVDGREKTRTCVELLKSIPGKTIIFVNTKRSADTLEADLYDLGCPSASIHGDKDQREREQVLTDFKSGKRPVMIATDVAARGIDVKDVKAVINYDFPGNIEDYIHRIGRTGRAGASGDAISFFHPDEDAAVAGKLAKVLRDHGQEVSEELHDLVKANSSRRFSTRSFRGNGGQRNRRGGGYRRDGGGNGGAAYATRGRDGGGGYGGGYGGGGGSYGGGGEGRQGSRRRDFDRFDDDDGYGDFDRRQDSRSEEHTSELQSP